ncbi:MAG: thioredoxin fold domain-containing protein [Sulfuricaulis sp.]
MKNGIRWLGWLALVAVLASPAAIVHAQTAQAMPESVDPVMAKLATAHWIAEGKGKRILYVFVDPNCPYCHELFEALQPEIKPRDLQVRFIVAGYLTTTSQGKAAAILTAKDPLAALKYNERNFGRRGFGGGIDETLASDKTIAELAVNYKLLMATGSTGVPAMVVLDRHRAPRLVEGAPDRKALRKILDNMH